MNNTLERRGNIEEALKNRETACTKTQNNEMKPPNRNGRNERNERKSPKQGKPLLLLRANRKQTNLGVFQANLSDIQANRSARYTPVSLNGTPVSLNITQVSLFTVSSQ